MVRRKKRVYTPWGDSQHAETTADGIVFHTTAGHGGVYLSDERHKELQAKFKFPTFAKGQWYEEDCDVAAVVIAFPEVFGPEKWNRALEAARSFTRFDKESDRKWAGVVAYAEKYIESRKQ